MFDEMIDKVIRKFGFEDNRTIVFASLCEEVEKGNDSIAITVKDFYKMLIEE